MSAPSLAELVQMASQYKEPRFQMIKASSATIARLFVLFGTTAPDPPLQFQLLLSGCPVFVDETIGDWRIGDWRIAFCDRDGNVVETVPVPGEPS